MDLPDPAEVVRLPGPWTHRDVHANGARFHVAEIGSGPLVLLLHGFPTYWWTWRHQLVALADAGFRAVAVDLRGYGGSDHTPHGYDPVTAANDMAAVIRSLGEIDAVVVGHGWGGLVGWSLSVYEPHVVRALVPVSMPHPRGLRRAMLTKPAQLRRGLYAVRLQPPFTPEYRLERHGAARIETILHARAAPGSTWPDADTAAHFRAAMLVPYTAHCAIEYHRWTLRSIPRPDGIRFQRAMKTPVDVPVLHVHGELDPSILAVSYRGSDEYVTGPYDLRVVPGVGHYPHEEAPGAFSLLLLGWLDALSTSNEDAR